MAKEILKYNFFDLKKKGNRNLIREFDSLEKICKKEEFIRIFVKEKKVRLDEEKSEKLEEKFGEYISSKSIVVKNHVKRDFPEMKTEIYFLKQKIDKDLIKRFEKIYPNEPVIEKIELTCSYLSGMNSSKIYKKESEKE